MLDRIAGYLTYRGLKISRSDAANIADAYLKKRNLDDVANIKIGILGSLFQSKYSHFVIIGFGLIIFPLAFMIKSTTVFFWIALSMTILIILSIFDFGGRSNKREIAVELFEIIKEDKQTITKNGRQIEVDFDSALDHFNNENGQGSDRKILINWLCAISDDLYQKNLDRLNNS